MNINNNINSIRQKVPAGCKLIAVSKTQPVEKILEAYNTGQRIFGENKVQELVAKHSALPQDIEWHMIGHLQSNKVKQLLPFVSLIHGVDSFKLLEEINRHSEKISRTTRCLLQIYIAREESKFGLEPREVLDLIGGDRFTQLRNVKITGLMGMATFTENRDVVRREFKSLKVFFDQLRGSDLPDNIVMEELSMGMSGDFEIAIEEGSTMVRIGTAIFGSRNYN
jgi:PLP dependent protein